MNIIWKVFFKKNDNFYPRHYFMPTNLQPCTYVIPFLMYMLDLQNFKLTHQL